MDQLIQNKQEAAKNHLIYNAAWTVQL